MQNPFKKLASHKDLAFRQVLSATKKAGFPSWQQWKQLPRVLSLKERKLLLSAISAIFLSLLSLSAWYVATHRMDIPAVGGDYTEALIGEPRFVNPIYASASDVDADLTKLVYSGLMKWDPASGLTNDLASDVQVSEDGKTYTIKIRDDARFHNGDQVRARDVIFTIDAIQDPQYHSPLAVSFQGVAVSQVDDTTVQFSLEEPFAPFLSTLTVGILPANVWGDIAPRNALLASRNLEPIGSGPYKFSQFSKDKTGTILSYTLERNPDYYGGTAHIQNLTFKFYASATEAARALENRNVEGASFVPSDLETEVSNVRSVNVLHPELAREVALYFNQSSSDVLKDKAVRTAIAQAIDKTAVMDAAVGGHGQTIDAPILPGFIGEDPDVAKIGFDLAGAQKTLEDAGYKLPEGQTVRTLKKAPSGDAPNELSVTITTVKNAEFVQAAELIASELGAAGIKAEVNPVENGQFFATVIEPHAYQILLTGTLLGIDPDPYPFWHSSQNRQGGLNLALYANRNADTLLETARKATNADDRAKAYRDFQDLVAADVPAVFLYQSSYAYAIGTKVKGVDIPSIISPADRFANVVDWYVKTKKVLK